MPGFQDKHGRDYWLTIDADSFWRMRRIAGVNVCKLSRESLIRLFESPLPVVWAIVEPQAWLYGIDSRADFLRSLSVDSIKQIINGFYEAFVERWPVEMARIPRPKNRVIRPK